MLQLAAMPVEELSLHCVDVDSAGHHLDVKLGVYHTLLNDPTGLKQ